MVWVLTELRLVDLRQMFATIALGSGEAVTAVQEQLGHSSPMTAQPLCPHRHLRPRQLRSAPRSPYRPKPTRRPRLTIVGLTWIVVQTLGAGLWLFRENVSS